MMVIPQIRSLRPAVIVAVFFFLILTILTLLKYFKVKDDNIRFEQEKNLVLNELSEMIESYNSVEVLNDTLRLQLEQSKEKMVIVRDSVRTVKLNQALIAKFRDQIKILKVENKKILSFIDGLESENQSLKNERRAFEKTLKARDSLTELIESKYTHLLDENDKLSEYRKLFVSNLSAEAAKRVTSRNRVVDTRYARRTNKFHITFTIVKNEFLIKGPKTFYFQIMDSNRHIISDQGTVNFGNTSLNYSGKITVNYRGDELTVSAIIDKNNEEELSKGDYYISIFHKGSLISKTSMTLK
ncbi:hypothetical protein [Lacinutrix sp. Hel_I_90]|uniref:hypothetical protein n=1 Tax=Lacinutrix sp. Hel_I_90 TaxID=1249999 RepID=UPI0005C95998|nr:hypothetical protein [Lacinutrix sp. Hel_I_90]